MAARFYVFPRTISGCVRWGVIQQRFNVLPRTSIGCVREGFSQHVFCGVSCERELEMIVWFERVNVINFGEWIL